VLAVNAVQLAGAVGRGERSDHLPFQQWDRLVQE